jgi:hypothetical protein
VYVKNDTTRKEHKMKLLMENQEIPFADYYRNGNISNLIFHTDHPLAWHSAILPHYPPVKRGNPKQFQLDFHLIKELAQQEKLSKEKDTPTPSGSDQTS